MASSINILPQESAPNFSENELIKPSLNKKFQYHSTSEINKIAELGIEKYLKTKEGGIIFMDIKASPEIKKYFFDILVDCLDMFLK